MVVQDTGRGAGLLGDLDPNALNSLEEDLEGADPSEEPPMVVAQWLIFKGDCLSNVRNCYVGDSTIEQRNYIHAPFEVTERSIPGGGPRGGVGAAPTD